MKFAMLAFAWVPIALGIYAYRLSRINHPNMYSGLNAARLFWLTLSAAVVVGGFALFVYGQMSSVIALQQLAVVVYVFGATWTLFGHLLCSARRHYIDWLEEIRVARQVYGIQ